MTTSLELSSPEGKNTKRTGIAPSCGFLETTSAHNALRSYRPPLKLCSAPVKAKRGFSSLLSYCTSPALRLLPLQPSLAAPHSQPSLQPSFIPQILFPVRSFCSLFSFAHTGPFYLRPSLALLPSSCPATLFKSDPPETRANNEIKRPFLSVFASQAAPVLQGDGPAPGNHRWHHCCFLHVHQKRRQLQPPEPGRAEAAHRAGVHGHEGGEDPALQLGPAQGLPSSRAQGYGRVGKVMRTHVGVQDSWIPGKGTFFPGKDAFKAQDVQRKPWGDAGVGLGLLECS